MNVTVWTELWMVEWGRPQLFRLGYLLPFGESTQACESLV